MVLPCIRSVISRVAVKLYRSLNSAPEETPCDHCGLRDRNGNRGTAMGAITRLTVIAAECEHFNARFLRGPLTQHTPMMTSR
jgi:hypothetical protein